MPDELDDRQLRSAFAQYRTDVLTQVPGQDISAVHAIARRHRHNRLGVISVTALFALAAPLAVSAVDNPTKPTIHSPTAPSSSSGPSSSASPSSESPSAPPTQQLPDGRISLSQLSGATVDLPQWGGEPESSAGSTRCPTRQVTFHQGRVDLNQPYVTAVAYADVDQDGATETVALLGCLLGQTATEQVVAFERDPDGAIVAIAQVVTHGSGPGTVAKLFALQTADSGTVGVQVGDKQPCCGTEDWMIERQWRWYSMTGGAFSQVGGPTAFHPSLDPVPTLSTTITPVTLGSPSAGTRTGTGTVTVHNTGPGAAPGIRLTVRIAHSADGSGISGTVTVTGELSGCSVEGNSGLVCHYPALAAGASRTYTFTIKWPAAVDGTLTADTVWQASCGVEQPGIRGYPVPDGTDATASGAVQRAAANSSSS